MQKLLEKTRLGGYFKCFGVKLKISEIFGRFKFSL